LERQGFRKTDGGKIEKKKMLEGQSRKRDF